MSVLLKVDQLTKNFGGLRAVNELSFSVEQGSIVGLIGPNGAGKTTLFNMVAGYFSPSSGEVHFDGMRVTHRPPYDRVALGLVRTFQTNVLYNESTVLENVLRGCAVRHRVGLASSLLRTKACLEEERSQLQTAIDILEFVELDRHRDEAARELAYGHQRALGVAIALATQPKLMMLDEPVAGMNPTETDQMARLIARLTERGITIIVVEHDMRFVMRLCHRLVVMNYGKKICEGEPAAVRENPDVISAYLGAPKHGMA